MVFKVAEYTPELVSSFVATQDYISIAGELQERPPGVTLVCGGVNSGKSTFCRYPLFSWLWFI